MARIITTLAKWPSFCIHFEIGFLAWKLLHFDSTCPLRFGFGGPINSSPPSTAYMHQWMGSALVQIWWLVAYSSPSLGPLTTNLKNFNQNTKISIQINVPENIVCEMAAILSRGDELITNQQWCTTRPQWVDSISIHNCGHHAEVNETVNDREFSEKIHVSTWCDLLLSVVIHGLKYFGTILWKASCKRVNLNHWKLWMKSIEYNKHFDTR